MLSAIQREERPKEKGRELAIIAVLARGGINLPYGRRPPCSLVWSGVVRQLLLPVAVGHPEEIGHPFSTISVHWKRRVIRGEKIVLFVNIFGSLEGLDENSVKGSHVEHSAVAHRIVLSQWTYYVIHFKRIKTGCDSGFTSNTSNKNVLFHAEVYCISNRFDFLNFNSNWNVYEKSKFL